MDLQTTQDAINECARVITERLESLDSVKLALEVNRLHVRLIEVRDARKRWRDEYTNMADRFGTALPDVLWGVEPSELVDEEALAVAEYLAGRDVLLRRVETDIRRRIIPGYAVGRFRPTAAAAG